MDKKKKKAFYFYNYLQIMSLLWGHLKQNLMYIQGCIKERGWNCLNKKRANSYQTPHHTLAFVYESWQTNIYHLQDFYQIKQIRNMKHNFSYIPVSQKTHIKLTNPIWKQSNMYFLNFSIIILLLAKTKIVLLNIEQIDVRENKHYQYAL